MNGNGNKPVASVSLDLDNLWSYMKTRGDEGWRERPTYIPTFVPMVLDTLAKRSDQLSCVLGFRTPFRLSYLLCLIKVAPELVMECLRTVLELCRLLPVDPSPFLHRLDLLFGEGDPQLRFFPGTDLSPVRKPLSD